MISFYQFKRQRITKQSLYISSHRAPDLTYHVFEASQHCSSNDAQKEGHDVEDGSGPQQVIKVHHVLAALHICVFVVASDHLYTASPVGDTEKETAYSQATEVTKKAQRSATGSVHLYSGHNERHTTGFES